MTRSRDARRTTRRRPHTDARRAGCTAGFAESLGIRGWQRLDAILLAALAAEAPLLLVGAHGTAKSLLVERVAGALGHSFRHYNASLLNYDDLVGIPMPDETGRELHFAAAPGAVWGAEFVFLDEISRCRVDLQNKLFPLIHERRVAGVDLPALRHRWAAMNPPPAAQPAPGDDDYLGAEPLDPALADRFAFVVRVPTWDELGRDTRRAVVLGGDPAPGHARLLRERVVRTAHLAAALAPGLRRRLADYVVTLVDRLADGDVRVSPRRARMLLENIVFVHAARLVLHGQDTRLAGSSETALRNGLPHTAGAVPPEPALLIAAHRHAWDVAALPARSARRAILEERDPVLRVTLAAELGVDDHELSQLVTKCLAETDSAARRMGVATAMMLAFGNTRQLDPAAWEALAELAGRVVTPSALCRDVAPGPRLETWREISQWMAQRTPTARAAIERNFVVAGFPDLWDDEPWRDALARFIADLDLFDVRDACTEAG